MIICYSLKDMAPSLHGTMNYAAMFMLLAASICSFSDCYDPLDPNGNVTVTFDILQWTVDGYLARVTIQNYYQYRHVDKPGWKLGWTWPRHEIIWSMRGAFATMQGNCSSFKTMIPHSCEKSPVIEDLSVNAPWENKSENCCHGGLLSASAIDVSTSFTSFEMTVGNLQANSTGNAPQALTLWAPGPGYTCDPVVDTAPTVTVIDGKRWVQVYRTWKSTCTYSSFIAKNKPVCCVSMSSFYNPTVTQCPKCSCGCREADDSVSSCVSASPSSLSDNIEDDAVRCTDHMCPVQVHWHVKNNYMDYWRVKLTISNHFYKKTYSGWNVLVQHPGFNQTAKAYSFNSTTLPTVGLGDEAALFWGLEYYNTELLHSEPYQLGSVTTEIVLKKDLNQFTLHNGWAFPRRIYFEGENCEMAFPDTFPTLPNGATSFRPTHCSLLLIFFSYMVSGYYYKINYIHK